MLTLSRSFSLFYVPRLPLSPRFPFLGFSMGTGHFTAMVWKATRRLGCAKGNCPGQNLWVCQYDPPGNMMGAFPQNVPPPL